MRPVCIRNFKKPRRKLNQVNVRKDFWGFTFRLLFSFLEGELTRLACKPRCVCVLTSFCCSVLLFRSGATESVPIDVACKNLQISVVSFRQRGLGSGRIPLSFTFPQGSQNVPGTGDHDKNVQLVLQQCCKIYAFYHFGTNQTCLATYQVVTGGEKLLRKVEISWLQQPGWGIIGKKYQQFSFILLA